MNRALWIANASTLMACLVACSSSGPSDRVKPPSSSEASNGTAAGASSADAEASGEESGSEGEMAEPEVDATPTVTFHTDGGDVVVAVEVADDVRARMRGMMYRESLDEDRGMIFVFPEVGIHPFWMKNTYVSLDMIHLNPELEVVGIVKRAEPLTLDQRKIDRPSKYVVEVTGGFAEKYGVTAGTRTSLANVPKDGR